MNKKISTVIILIGALFIIFGIAFMLSNNVDNSNNDNNDNNVGNEEEINTLCKQKEKEKDYTNLSFKSKSYIISFDFINCLNKIDDYEFESSDKDYKLTYKVYMGELDTFTDNLKKQYELNESNNDTLIEKKKSLNGITYNTLKTTYAKNSEYNIIIQDSSEIVVVINIYSNGKISNDTISLLESSLKIIKK